MLNRVQLIGYLGADPALRQARKQPRTTVRIATRRRWADGHGNRRHEIQWHDLVFWGQRAELVHQLLRSGQLVYVEGFLRHSNWTDPKDPGRTVYRSEVVGETYRILSPKPAEAEPAPAAEDPS